MNCYFRVHVIGICTIFYFTVSTHVRNYLVIFHALRQFGVRILCARPLRHIREIFDFRVSRKRPAVLLRNKHGDCGTEHRVSYLPIKLLYFVKTFTSEENNYFAVIITRWLLIRATLRSAICFKTQGD